MPGILPMKVIKVGSSSQSRIAQACDRCRSKKIRCDGIRPTCSQCSVVGFECRTSDKLSRRAFPRGYTESLEERVRALETEVSELKDLLDEKDEKIELLSKMHGNRRRPSITSDSTGAAASPDAKKATHPAKEDTFRVQASPLLLGVENSDSYFMGPSSGRAFIETLKRKIQETGKPCNDFNPEAFLHLQGCHPLAANSPGQPLRVPPRLFSDRCVNVYFQEWAPLFPVLHKPTFLHIYEEFVADPEKVKNSHKLAQLYLVFNIAGLSSANPDMPQLALCEQQWTTAIESVLMDNTMNTLQCLVLALIYCTLRADYKRLQHYKAIAVSLSHRLGLHQSQKRFSFGALTIETRKKVFWTLYTLDCFTSAVLGLPKLLKEADVQAEYPSDVDDEYVTEKGFQPTLPGEYTRLSNALALFRATHILARVLERNYPATNSHELSLQQMSELESELDAWYEGLPSHLRLNFVQDKPSTDVTGSRSPLLALAYYYIRTLIYRPAVGSTLGSKAAPALMSIGDSSKHIIQIVQLLEERNMSFSFCLNKGDLLVLCGMTLLYQVVDFKQDGKLMRDNERLVNAVIKTLGGTEAPGSLAFKRVANMLVSVDEPVEVASPPKKSRERSMPAPAPSQRASPPGNNPPKKQANGLGQRADAAMSESDLLQQQDKMRRMTMPTLAGQRPQLYRARSRQSFDNLQQDVSLMQRDHRLSVSRVPTGGQRNLAIYRTRPNLDYLSLNNTPNQSQPTSPGQGRMQPPTSLPRHQSQQPNAQMNTKMAGISGTEWEALLGSMDGGVNNVYDAIYGGNTSLVNEASMPTSNPNDWSPDAWDLSTFNLGDFGDFGNPAPPQSVLSISDESLSSGEEIAPSELGLSVGSVDYHGQMLPTQENGFIDGLDTFSL